MFEVQVELGLIAASLGYLTLDVRFQIDVQALENGYNLHDVNTSPAWHDCTTNTPSAAALPI